MRDGAIAAAEGAARARQATRAVRDIVRIQIATLPPVVEDKDA